MNVTETELPGVFLIEPRVFKDDRGSFLETFQRQRYEEAGIVAAFVQDNLSYSTKNTMRGLHYQNPQGQAKLVQVIQGTVYDVAVDIRVGSPAFGKWVGVELSGDNHCQLFIPEGFAHGFVVLSESAVFSYKCSNYYSPEAEGGIIFSDPGINIDWPQGDFVLSAKDTIYPCLSDIDPQLLPKYNE
jgi:dTDP-4-dehydrorhamnose 3,5-epimerase